MTQKAQPQEHQDHQGQQGQQDHAIDGSPQDPSSEQSDQDTKPGRSCAIDDDGCPLCQGFKGWLTMLAAAGLIAAVIWLTGCEKALFSEDEQRTPYDRFLLLRDQRAPATRPGPQGDKAALRQRLAPMDRRQ